MIAVFGGTGTSGREVVARLAAAGLPVRAVVRDPSRAAGTLPQDVELAAGDLDDPASVAAALEGTDRAFFVTAVDARFPERFATFLDAAKSAGLRHVVKFSGMGATVDSPSELIRQHATTDAALISSGLPFTILRPNSFHQNLLASAATIKAQGAFYLPMADARQSLVDVRDIADVAAAVLSTPGHEGQTYEVTGPESLTYGDVADRLSEALGKTVRYVDVPAEAAVQAMTAAGMPEWNARAVAGLFELFRTGVAARTTDTVATLTGHPPIPFAQFARDHAAAFA